MSGNHGHLHDHNEVRDVESTNKSESSNPRIGLCEFLRDDDRRWEDVFTLTIKSWKLTIRNSEEFHAGNITFLEKQKPANSKKPQKDYSVDHTIAIDSGCPPHNNRNLANEIKETNKSLYLINTHGHHDHVLGNLVFIDAGADIVAHKNARNLMARLEGFDPSALPNITFEKRMSLQIDDIEAKILHLPSGHTNGDVAVWIPKLDILHTGDTFMTEGYPLIDIRNGGRIRGLIRAVTKMIRISGKNTLIIPGHGNLRRKANGDIDGPKREDLIKYRHMLETVTAEVELLKEMGYGLDEINAKKPTHDFDKEWNNNLICPENFVSFVYNSLPGDREQATPCKDSSRDLFPRPARQKTASKRTTNTEIIRHNYKPTLQNQPFEEDVVSSRDVQEKSESMGSLIALRSRPTHFKSKGRELSPQWIENQEPASNIYKDIKNDHAKFSFGNPTIYIQDALLEDDPFEIHRNQRFTDQF